MKGSVYSDMEESEKKFANFLKTELSCFTKIND
jgi:hypothetical protein